MTNQAIIENERLALVITGAIEPTEELHTFQGWKARGYAVKKGVHAVVETRLWKHKTATKVVRQGDTEQEVDASHCYMTKAFLFSTSQVQPLQ